MFRVALLHQRKCAQQQARAIADLKAHAPKDWRLAEVVKNSDEMLDRMLDLPLHPRPPGVLRRIRWWLSDHLDVAARRLRGARAALAGYAYVEVDVPRK